MKRCPECGGSNVQEMLAGWFDANPPNNKTGDELTLAELYSHPYYCQDCEDHPDHLVETDDTEHSNREIIDAKLAVMGHDPEWKETDRAEQEDCRRKR